MTLKYIITNITHKSMNKIARSSMVCTSFSSFQLSSSKLLSRSLSVYVSLSQSFHYFISFPLPFLCLHLLLHHEIMNLKCNAKSICRQTKHCRWRFPLVSQSEKWLHLDPEAELLHLQDSEQAHPRDIRHSNPPINPYYPHRNCKKE